MLSRSLHHNKRALFSHQSLAASCTQPKRRDVVAWGGELQYRFPTLCSLSEIGLSLVGALMSWWSAPRNLVAALQTRLPVPSRRVFISPWNNGWDVRIFFLPSLLAQNATSIIGCLCVRRMTRGSGEGDWRACVSLSIRQYSCAVCDESVPFNRTARARPRGGNPPPPAIGNRKRRSRDRTTGLWPLLIIWDQESLSCISNHTLAPTAHAQVRSTPTSTDGTGARYAGNPPPLGSLTESIGPRLAAVLDGSAV